MTYNCEILPVFEAFCYLTERFSSRRTSDRIEILRSDSRFMHYNNWALVQKLSEFEHELDEAFPADDLLKLYFSPLQCDRDVMEREVSIGSILLSVPNDVAPPKSFDEIVEHYRSAPRDAVIRHFSDVLLWQRAKDPTKAFSDLAGMMAYIDELLTDPIDKWNLIDSASNPIRHLETMRPLVEAISMQIEKRIDEFMPLMEESKKLFLSCPDYKEKFKSLHYELDDSRIENMIVYPGLFLFNGIHLSIDDAGNAFAAMGFFVDVLMSCHNNPRDLEQHLSILKIMSDGTRLKALYSMCGRYSYGQELASMLGGSRNAMYYHLEKMLAYGLVDCKPSEYRTLYTMNKENVYNKLTELRDFLVDGWTPEKR